jgi:hypothetical protein
MPKSEIGKSDKIIAGKLFADVSILIEQSKKTVALIVNLEMTLLYWRIGEAINNTLLKNKRAEYGEAIIATLSQQLTTSFGRGWRVRHLWHCVRVARHF